ncbi:MAG: SDR family oxidoreductase [Actinomycetota bacterium]|nr:SDR family oxidoreductase [Actinomycetota bacterium]
MEAEREAGSVDGKGLGRVRGKSTVVTGAARGIGKPTARLFAREGARLVLNDVDEDGLDRLTGELRRDGGDVGVAVGDVAVVVDAQRIVSTAVDAYGRLDVLVANAGVIPLANVLEATPEDYDHVMAVDGRGMWLTCKYAIEAMLRTGGGAIVCLSSISGLAGQRDQAAYGPAKFVASGITKHLAVEWAAGGPRPVRPVPAVRVDRRRHLFQSAGRRQGVRRGGAVRTERPVHQPDVRRGTQGEGCQPGPVGSLPRRESTKHAGARASPAAVRRQL